MLDLKSKPILVSCMTVLIGSYETSQCLMGSYIYMRRVNVLWGHIYIWDESMSYGVKYIYETSQCLMGSYETSQCLETKKIKE